MKNDGIKMSEPVKRTRNPKGTRDFGPNDVERQTQMIHTMKEVFEIYGGQPIHTPILERLSTVENLYGEEFDHLVYQLDDQGEPLILRYDLTLPFVRYVANHGLRKFKKYQIGKV